MEIAAMKKTILIEIRSATIFEERIGCLRNALIAYLKFLDNRRTYAIVFNA